MKCGHAECWHCLGKTLPKAEKWKGETDILRDGQIGMSGLQQLIKMHSRAGEMVKHAEEWYSRALFRLELNR